MSIDVVIIAGGTGGHIFPAINVYTSLKERYGHSVSFVSDKRFFKFSSKTNNVKPDLILNISNSKNRIKFSFTFIYSFFQSFKFILSNKPKVIVGFGGYITLPILFSAFILRKKVILHESNSVLGKANKLFAFYAKKITTGMPEIINYHDNNKRKKLIYTSNPVDNNCVYTKYPNLDNKIKTILVFAGSQGAKIFSNQVTDAIIEAKKNIHDNIGIEIEVIQQCVKSDIGILKNKYKDAEIQNIVSDFFPDIIEKMKKSSIIICRGGAQTISEIINVNRNAIIIPYKWAIYNHQYENAKMVSKYYKNSIKILKEDDPMFHSKLQDLLYYLLYNKNNDFDNSSNNTLNSMLFPKKDLANVIHEHVINE